MTSPALSKHLAHNSGIKLLSQALQQVLDRPWLTLVIVTYLVLAWVSWGKLGDPIIDIGHEVEIPRRLLMGQVLYRDIQIAYGPFPYYLHALALKVFGQHLEVFYITGLLVSFTLVGLVFRLGQVLTNQVWAALMALAVVGYGVFVPGLYNFVLPYSYGCTYGMVFGLGAIVLLWHYTRELHLGWLLLSGLSVTLALLSKPEYGMSALVAVWIGLNLSPMQRWQTRLKHNVLWLMVVLVTTGVPLAFLAAQSSWQTLYQSFFPVGKFALLNRNLLFRTSWLMTVSSWWTSAKVALPDFLFLLGAMTLSRKLPLPQTLPWQPALKFSLGTLLGGLGLWLGQTLATHHAPHYLHPLDHLQWTIPVIGVWFLLQIRGFKGDIRGILLVTLLVYAALLNARWLWDIRAYGLYATPVVILFLVFCHDLAGLLRWRLAAVLWAGLVIGLVMRTGEFQAYRWAISSTYGTIYTNDQPLAQASQQTIELLAALKVRTALVLPEGSLLNFLSNTTSPSRETNLIPGILATPQEEHNFVTQMHADPPQAIVLVDPLLFEQQLWGYSGYAAYNPLVSTWITQEHYLVNRFPMSLGSISIYVP